MLKINILYKTKHQPWGGGNQFLKALGKIFLNMMVYEKDIEKADVILFNSQHYLKEIFRVKKNHYKKIIIYRIDGPISKIRGKDKEIDKIIKIFADNFADGIIFQSNWSRERNRKLFKISAPYETIVYNAPDNKIFNRIGKKEFNPKEKIKLIAASWSSNWRKGFEVYKYLDENLDFSRYEMTFVGNSPIEFENIKHIKPVDSKKLADILKQHDIYITASQNDPCSNSLIEAMNCGLPAVALNDGGHPELVRNGGELFKGKKDVIEKIEKVSQNYYYYQSRIFQFSIEKTAQMYYEFAERIYKDVQSGNYQPKQVKFSTKINFYKMKFLILKLKLKGKIEFLKRKIWKI